MTASDGNGAVGSAPAPAPPIERGRVAALATAGLAEAGLAVEVPGVVGLLTVRGDPADAPLADAFERVLGCGVPARLSSTAAADRRVRWMSPDEWLVSCPLEDVGTLERELRDALDGARGAAVTDVSGGLCVLVLGGPAVREVLARCVPIDLDPRVFGPGRVASTVFAKTGATLGELGDGRIELICRRSFADYVLRFLANAARESGFALADVG